MVLSQKAPLVAWMKEIFGESFDATLMRKVRRLYFMGHRMVLADVAAAERGGARRG